MFAAMDQGLPSDMPITLVIKAPNQRMADQTVDCMLGWTIRKLKQHLEKVYPSKPKHNEQRLIYSGKLLQDHLTLKEILRQYDENEQTTRHTVHLVCSKSSDSSTNLVSKSTGEQIKVSSNETTTASSTASQNISSSAQQQSAASDGLRYRGSNTFSESAASPIQQPGVVGNFGEYPQVYGTYTGVPNSLTVPAGYTPDQYAWFMQQQQQAYSQYMMQYMQYYQSIYYSGQPFHPQMVTPLTYTQQPPNLNPAGQHQQPQPQQAPARPNNDANDLPRMNAQGGIDQEDDNDLEPRDWLHHVYFFMRFLTFMGFLFFYSNPTRFLLVSSGSIAIYFLQKIRRHMQRIHHLQEQERQQQQQEEAERQRHQNPQQQEDNAGGEVNVTEHIAEDQRQQGVHNEALEAPPVNHQGTREVGSDSGSVHTQGQTEALRQEQDQGNWIVRGFIFVCMTIQAFFTSLLPTPPELLEAN